MSIIYDMRSGELVRSRLYSNGLDIVDTLFRYNPLKLFAAGQQGAIYDPSDVTSLWQDAAGTVPVTKSGDPVGLMLDKSGNGNHATQTVSAARPTYQTDGILHKLKFDGADDWLLCKAMPWLLNSGYSALVSVSYQTTATGGYVFHSSLVTTTAAMLGLVLYPSSDAILNGFSTNNTYAKSSNARVVAYTYNLASESGVVSVDSNVSTREFSNGGNKSDVITIGCRTPSSPAAFFKGDFYGFCIANTFSESGVSELSTYLANKAGVTL